MEGYDATTYGVVGTAAFTASSSRHVSVYGHAAA